MCSAGRSRSRRRPSRTLACTCSPPGSGATPAQASWRVFGGYTERSRSAAATPSTLVVDSLTSDPVSDLIDQRRRHRAPLGARRARRSSRDAAASDRRRRFRRRPRRRRADRDRSRLANWSTVRPRVCGRCTPAAAATFDISRRWPVFGNEHVTAGRLTLDAGLRLEASAARRTHRRAEFNGRRGCRARCCVGRSIGTGGLALVASYRRSAYQLPLNVLAIGDPAAPVADVSVWHGTSTGPLIARVGPGTGGDADVHANRSATAAAHHRRRAPRVRVASAQGTPARAGVHHETRTAASRAGRHRRARVRLHGIPGAGSRASCRGVPRAGRR